MVSTIFALSATIYGCGLFLYIGYHLYQRIISRCTEKTRSGSQGNRKISSNAVNSQSLPQTATPTIPQGNSLSQSQSQTAIQKKLPGTSHIITQPPSSDNSNGTDTHTYVNTDSDGTDDSTYENIRIICRSQIEAEFKSLDGKDESKMRIAKDKNFKDLNRWPNILPSDNNLLVDLKSRYQVGNKSGTKEHIHDYYGDADDALKEKVLKVYGLDCEWDNIPDRFPIKTNYINASLIYNPKNKEKLDFIATQGPMKNTIGQFWFAVLQEDCPIIVMLCNLKEGGKWKCSPYFPDTEGETLDTEKNANGDQIRVTLKSRDETHPSIIIRKFLLKLNGEEKKQITHIHYTKWADFGAVNADEMIGLISAMRVAYTGHGLKYLRKPALVHCSAGVGRTGTFIECAWIEKGDIVKREDISKAVNKMRLARPNLIQTEVQYVLVYGVFVAISHGKYQYFDDTPKKVDDIKIYMNTSKATNGVLMKSSEWVNFSARV